MAFLNANSTSVKDMSILNTTIIQGPAWPVTKQSLMNFKGVKYIDIDDIEVSGNFIDQTKGSGFGFKPAKLLYIFFAMNSRIINSVFKNNTLTNSK